MKTELEHITIDSVSKAGPVERLQDDVALVYDISRIRLPEEPKRMDCLLFAFCVKGQAEYTVDTIHHTISAGQIIIIGIKQVVSGVHFSDDCIGRGVFISENYTREILSGMRDLSSIFLFSRMHPVFSMNKEGIQSMLNFFLLIRQKISESGHRFRLKQNPHDFVIVTHLVFVGQAGDTLAGDNERRSVAFSLVHVRAPFDEFLDFLDVPVFHRDNEFCALLLVFPVILGNGCGVFEGIKDSSQNRQAEKPQTYAENPRRQRCPQVMGNGPEEIAPVAFLIGFLPGANALFHRP